MSIWGLTHNPHHAIFRHLESKFLFIQGGAAGGALGAAAGTLIDEHNRWRGAVIGGALGVALDATVTEISTRMAREAAQTGRPVTYQSNDGWQKVEATPVAYNARTKCHKVRERI